MQALSEISGENRPKVRQIRSEYGSLGSFLKKAREWVDHLPKDCVKSHKALIKLKQQTGKAWPITSITALHRMVTSVEHAKWLGSVLDRIEEIKKLVQNKELNERQLEAGREEFLRKRLQHDKKTALDFIEDVESQVHESLDVTEKQLNALNKIHKRYKSI